MDTFLGISTDLLTSGYRVRFRADGWSMHPTIRDGEAITVAPVRPADVRRGDIILYRGPRGAIAHRVVRIQSRGRDLAALLLRGDSADRCDAPVTPERILGKVVAVDRNGGTVKLNTQTAKLLRAARVGAARINRMLSLRVTIVRLLLLFALLGGARSAQAQILSGSYAGNATDNRAITGLGFQPDVVIVKGNTTQIGVIRTSSMTGDNAKPMTGATALTADLIQSLDAIGFTVGTDARVNGSGVTYYWVAFKGTATEIKVATYTGNGADTQAITGVGFQPELVFIMSASAVRAVFRPSLSPNAFDFADGGRTTDWISSMDADGFTVGTLGVAAAPEVNQTGVTYHYVAWNEVAGTTDVGTYTGDGLDNRNITGVGFQPEYVLVRSSRVQHTVHHPASLGITVDDTLFFDAQASVLNRIQALQADGFQVGTDVDVNENNRAIFFFAWKRVAPTAVRLISFTATSRADGRATLVRWQTGHEVDNLGFHVHRQDGDKWTRLTPSLIAGSGLLVGQGTALTAGHSYTWWDVDATGPVSYWLEDVDFKATSTWHGPITPVAGGPGLPEQVSSILLERLGRTSATGHPAVKPTIPMGRSRDADPREATPGEIATQWFLAAGPAVKLAVRAPGWYRVGQPELAAAGLDTETDPRTLQLFVNGIEPAILVTGEEDGRFDAEDAVEFYGTGVDTPYTDTRVYWLVAGSAPGRRIAIEDGREPGPIGAPSFAFTVERRDRTVFFAALQNGEEDNFFGPIISKGAPVDQSVTVTHPDPAPPGDAVLEVSVQGVTTLPDVNPDHRVGVLLNGTEVGEVVFDGRDRGVQTRSVPHARLREGQNVVTLVARGGPSDTSLVDYVRLTYWHTYSADDNALQFTAVGQDQVTVGGFRDASVRVVDLTDPTGVSEVLGTVAREADGFAFTCRVPRSGRRTLLAMTDDTIAAPASVGANQPSSWHQAGQAGDIVFVAPADFLDSLEPLRAHRAGQGYAVVLVDVEDLYDEFTFGEKRPHAIKEFLASAEAGWTRPPQFVLLAGNATTDPRDYLGLGEPDFVPTKLVPTAVLETASDDWFADADGDGLPELAVVGRLPARTVAQVATMVSKIVGYEEAAEAPWTRELLLVADENDAETNFEALSSALRPLVPEDYTVREIFRGPMGTAAARAELIGRINQGQGIVNYLGHASVEAWRAELFNRADAALLTNGPRLPFVVAMSCLTGFFHGLYPEESLAEALLRAPNGGAVAVWASSGATAPREQALLNRELVRLLFGGGAGTLGEAVTAAKVVVSDRDVRRSWIFFGDPAMRLKGVPPPSPEGTSQTPASPPALPAFDPYSAGRDGPSGPPGRVGEALALYSAGRGGPSGPPGRSGVGLTLSDPYSAGSGGPSGPPGRVGEGLPPYSAGSGDGRDPLDWQILSVDLNGDGLADRFLYNTRTGVWIQAFNNGDETFPSHQSHQGAWSPGWQAQSGDFNGDRRDDVFLYDPASGVWFQCLADGRGDFTYAQGLWSRPWSVHTGDFNGDGLADVFVYDDATGHWFLAWNDGGGGFRDQIGDPWSPGWTIGVTHLDGDRRADIVLFHPATGEWRECFSGQPGQFTCQQRVGASGSSPIGRR